MKPFTATAIALSLLGASAAMADGHYGHDDGRHWSAEHRDFDGHRGNDRHDSHWDWREARRHEDRDDRWHDGREWRDHHEHDWREGRYPHDEYRRVWGYRDHYWRRGERLPVAYYAPSYVMGDYRAYGLREPPYGCRWVRVNNDVVLAAIGTGIVLEVAYNIF
jgi:Ni/Co efflux regulator RcnB